MDYYAKHIALERVLAKQMLKMHPSEANGCAWEYFNSAPFKWYGHSSKINKKTEIFVSTDLINFGYPRGTILHFTKDNTIYGTSTDFDENENIYGEKPIFYTGYFEINNHDFELSFDALEIGEIQFVPKKEAGI
jgi:hypothetical protein